jgi:hypothetical protein
MKFMINNTPDMAQAQTIAQLKELNKEKGLHFFSRDAMRFFNSRVQTNAPYNGCVFVTSEKCGYGSPRLYTVRAMHQNGAVSTISEFQEFTTREEAHKAAKFLAAKY